ncbi:4'-phosphopantetheinyl transferase family protein [Kitasatospora purpeofusca]|uniref:4'-phosphopantetheinyl transferase family protein n=1 Tax=Kitasatospora purpeofusca TaxID=67352 RepID=UPI0035E0DDCD
MPADPPPETASRPEELRHAERYRSRPAAVRYLWRRLTARRLVAAAADCGPAEVRLLRTPAGPLRVECRGRPAALTVSVSQSRDWTACAVGVEPLGLDIERHRPAGPPPPPGLPAAVLHPEELRAAGEPDWPALLRHWTLKEALAKATGHGIGGGGLTEVRVDPDAPGDTLRSAGRWAAPGAWSVWALDLGVPVAAALALPRRDCPHRPPLRPLTLRPL